jgi:hypothetical protein
VNLDGVLCIPSTVFKEIIFLDFKGDDEILQLDLFNFSTKEHVMKFNKDLMISKIELSHSPHIVSFHEKTGNILVGTNSNHLFSFH